MKQELISIKDHSLKELEELTSEKDIQNFKSRYLGRKGRLTLLLKNIKEVPLDERSAVGTLANEIKEQITSAINRQLELSRTKSKQQDLSREDIDVSLPGRPRPVGRCHPVTVITDRIIEVFRGLGFKTVVGPEVELDFFNFEALNIPKDHPARDMHDTFYIADDVLLRTHTSPVQIRTMQSSSPPLRILCPGKVYRCDSDISHTPMFHQIEGLMVDETITMGDLKGLLRIFIQSIFDENTQIRFRPSYFPFTEPSAEVDIQCVMCRGNGCSVCSQTGWLEILGCGLVNPIVFKNAGYDPDRCSGLAFGLGVERIAMLKFGINDIRLFYENDCRFLSQF